MFFVCHFLTTRLTFPSYYLKDITDRQFLLRHLKSQIQGRCLKGYGFLIQIMAMKGYEKQKGIHISAIQATQQGLQANVKFDCLCFRPQKGDLMDFYVESINFEMIRGKLGAAEIMIPRQKMRGLTYDENQNAFVTDMAGEKFAIRVGCKIRCRCFQWTAQMDIFMKIIAEVDPQLIFSQYQGKI